MQNNQQQLPFVALLVAAVLLFGAIWSQDEGLSRNGVSTNRSHREVVAKHNDTEKTHPDHADFQEIAEISDVSVYGIPIPVAPGRYCLVNNRGFSTMVSLTAELLNETGNVVPAAKQLYEFEQDGIRWYYIRLDSSDCEAEESDLSSVNPVQPLDTPRPRLRIALGRMLSSSLHTVRSSISSGYRLAADGAKAAVDRVVRTPARFFERLIQANRTPEVEHFPNTIPFSPAEIDTASSLDSIFY